MSTNNTRNEEQIEDIDSSSVDSFIRELEEKEKDLHISSDLVIEVDESEVEHDNIHDSFVAPNEAPPAAAPPGMGDNEELEIEPFETVDSVDLERKISELTAERDELKESLIRRQRDFDNHRKRTDRERTETFRNLVSNVASEMLPVLDNLNRALDAFSDAEKDASEKDFQNFFEGIVLVNQQLNEVLSSMGVQPIPSVGEAFDPQYHEAVDTVETDDHPPKTVLEEILRGYKVDEKVIRASMVRVAASKENNSE